MLEKLKFGVQLGMLCSVLLLVACTNQPTSEDIEAREQYRECSRIARYFNAQYGYVGKCGREINVAKEREGWEYVSIEGTPFSFFLPVDSEQVEATDVVTDVYPLSAGRRDPETIEVDDMSLGFYFSIQECLPGTWCEKFLNTSQNSWHDEESNLLVVEHYPESDNPESLMSIFTPEGRYHVKINSVYPPRSERSKKYGGSHIVPLSQITEARKILSTMRLN